MAKVRVYELAKELGVPSKDVMIRIQEMGEFARSASSTIEAPVVRKLKKSFEDERAQTSAGAARPPSTPPASTLSPGAPRPDPARLPDRVHDGRGRRALSLSIASFGGSTDSELELHTPLPLPFATVRAQALGQALTSFGYHWPKPLPSDRPAEMLGREVDGAISAAGRDEVLVVHILSHGHLAESGAVYVMGSDGRTHALTDVEHWLKTVEDFPDRPYTLFLLDLCHSGVAARLPWQVALADGSSRAWVIAACEPDEQAFAGRFSQAAANVLDRLYRGQLDIDRSVRYVPLATVAREIRREVDKLAAAARALPQQVTCSVIDISAQVDLPFFLNPGYLEDERNEVRGRIDTALAPFLDDLDDAFDARHFIGRLPGTARWLTVSVTAVSAAATMS